MGVCEMDQIVDQLPGIIGSGLITWFVARWYYLRQHRDDAAMVPRLADMLVDKLKAEGIVAPTRGDEARTRIAQALAEARSTRLLQAMNVMVPRRRIVGGRIVGPRTIAPPPPPPDKTS